MLAIGSAFTREPFTATRLLALAVAFDGSVALWWCYFGRLEAMGLEAAETAEDAGTVGWWGTQSLTLIVLAVIAPTTATRGFTILTFAGPALFLLAQPLFMRETLGQVLCSRGAGIATLLVLAVATAALTLIAGIAAASGAGRGRARRHAEPFASVGRSRRLNEPPAGEARWKRREEALHR